MKMTIATLLTAVLIAGMTPRYAATGPAKSTCLVCKATKGEAAEEPVKAVRAYEGREYGFCSDKCAKAFKADPAAYLPPVFPRRAPGFELEDLAGNAISTESLRGKVVLLDFWATWCAPCRESMPRLQAMHDRYAKQGFTVVGVSIDEGGSAKIRKFVASRKITYPVAVDSETAPAWDSYRVKAVPAAYLIDREGNIVAQWTGTPASDKELELKLTELLGTD